MVKEVAEELHLPIIDFHSAVPAQASYYVDGVHPNKKGARLMAIAVWEAINNRKFKQFKQ